MDLAIALGLAFMVLFLGLMVWLFRALRRWERPEAHADSEESGPLLPVGHPASARAEPTTPNDSSQP
ncbi:MAG: hypothetical protein Q4G21_02955 [Dermabacter sp.]|nr:hypothetical protein [Dermabacter sp.]